MVGVLVIIFVLFQVLGGDPARLQLDQRADVQTLEAIRKDLGLDRPKHIQFFMYINDISPFSFHNNSIKNQEKYRYSTLLKFSKSKVFVIKRPYLRRSWQTNREVTDILMSALPNTVILAVVSIILASIFGIFLGIIAAVNKNTLIDNVTVFTSIIGISLPSYVSGIIIGWLFGYLLSDITGLQMTGSLYEIDASGRHLALQNLILPAIALGIRPLAIIVQLTRSAMLDVLNQDYIRTAVAKGLTRRAVLFRHALRNALNPVITAISGWFAALLAGAFFIEIIFDWKGIGYYTIHAVLAGDFPVVMGSVLLTASFFVVINMMIDIFYGILDPRVSIKSN